MAKMRDGDYWSQLSAGRRLSLSAGFVPRYLWHFMVRPYRRDLAEVQVRSLPGHLANRHAAAGLDAWVSRFLHSYSRTAGYRPRRGSGELGIRYMRLMSVVNREFEHRLATQQSLALTDICADDQVQARICEWRQFAARCGHNDLGDLMSTDDLATDYAEYVAVTTKPDFPVSAALQIESIRLDSGGYLVRMAKLIDRFNYRTPGDGVLADIFRLGMAAKFADEMTDLALDHVSGRYNLLRALLAQYPAEEDEIIRRIRRSLPIPIGQWRASAPQAFQEFIRLFESYYRDLQSADLREIADLTMLRAARGPKPARGTAAREHVSQRPGPPRRLFMATLRDCSRGGSMAGWDILDSYVRRSAGFAGDLLILSRPFASLCAGAETLVGAHLSGHGSHALVPASALARESIAIVLITATVNVVNDVRDVAADAVSRPSRPLPDGRLSPSVAWLLAATEALIALVLSATVPRGIDVAVVLLTVGIGYSFALKGTVLLGNLTVAALAASPLAYGGYLAGAGQGPILYGVLVVSSYMFSYEVLKAIRDIAADGAAGYRTAATQWGAEAASWIFRMALSGYCFAAVLPMIFARVTPYYVIIMSLGGIIPPLVTGWRLPIGRSAAAVRTTLRVMVLAWIPGLVALALAISN